MSICLAVRARTHTHTGEKSITADAGGKSVHEMDTHDLGWKNVYILDRRTISVGQVVVEVPNPHSLSRPASCTRQNKALFKSTLFRK